MVQFIKYSRMGKEVTLDLKIGVLHAYPNGELQFENYDLQEQATAGERFKSRHNTEDTLNDANLESLARAMSTGASSANMKSCFMSIRTPATI